MYVGRDTVATPGAYQTNETNNRYDVFSSSSSLSDYLPIKKEHLSSLDKIGMLRYGTGVRYGTYLLYEYLRPNLTVLNLNLTLTFRRVQKKSRASRNQINTSARDC